MVVKIETIEMASALRSPRPKTDHQNASAETKKQVCCSTCSPASDKAARKRIGRCQTHRATAWKHHAPAGSVSARQAEPTSVPRAMMAHACFSEGGSAQAQAS